MYISPKLLERFGWLAFSIGVLVGMTFTMLLSRAV